MSAGKRARFEQQASSSVEERRGFNQYYQVDEKLFGMTEEQQKLRESVFNFAQQEIAPKVQGILKDLNHDDHREIWNKLGTLKILGNGVKKDYKGQGGGLIDCVIVQEELSRVGACYPIYYNTHVSHCIASIYNYGTEEQKLKYLPKLCSGEYAGALGLSDLSKPSASSLRSKKQADHYELNGNIILTGLGTDIVIVYVQEDGDTTGKKMTTFIIEKDFHGFNPSSNAFEFQKFKVPVANLLGEENKGGDVLKKCLDVEKIILAGGPVGFMQAICDYAYQYLFCKENKSVDFKDDVSDMYMRLYASRSYLYSMARNYENGYLTSKDCTGVLSECTENVKQVIVDFKKILGKKISDKITLLLYDVQYYEEIAGRNEKI